MMEHLSNNSLPHQHAYTEVPSTSGQATLAAAAAATAATSTALPTSSVNGNNGYAIYGNNSLINGENNISEGNSTNFHLGNNTNGSSSMALASGNSYHMGGGHSFNINGGSSIHAGTSSIHAGTSNIHAGTSNIHAGTNSIHAGTNSIHAGTNSIHAGTSNIHTGNSNIHAATSNNHAGISSINYGLNGISLHGNMNVGNSSHVNGSNSIKSNTWYNNNGSNSNNIIGGARQKVKNYHNTNGGYNSNINGSNSYSLSAISNNMTAGNTFSNNGGNNMNMNGIHNSNNMNGANSHNNNSGNNYNGGSMNGSNSFVTNGSHGISMNNGFSYGSYNITSSSVYNAPTNTRHINFSNVSLIGELAELTALANISIPDIGLTISTTGDATNASGSTNYSGTSSSHSSERCLPTQGGAYPEAGFPSCDPNPMLPTALRNIASPSPPPPRNDFFMANFLAACEEQNQQQLLLQKQKQQQQQLQQQQQQQQQHPNQQQQQQSLQQRKQQQQHHNQVLFNQPPPPPPPQHQQLVQATPEEEEEEGAVGGAPAPVAVIAPIGTGPRNSARTSPDVFPNVHVNIHANENINRDYICEVHNELYRYVCDFCRKLVCQCCTLHEHQDHCYISIHSFLTGSKDKLKNAINSSQTGTKAIKSSIDKALGIIRLVERNCNDLGETIRKAYRNFLASVEDRERYMLDFVDKLRARRLTLLHDQMAGLKSALAGLAETSEMLNQTADQYSTMDEIELALKLTNGQRQMEQFASIYKDLQPKNENMGFINPDYYALSDVRLHGGICYVDDENKPSQVLSSPSSVEVSLATMTIGKTPITLLTPNGKLFLEKRDRQQVIQQVQPNMTQMPPPPPRAISANGMNGVKIEWELSGIRSSPGLYMNGPRATQAVPGSTNMVYARHSNQSTISFAAEGHDDGQVSRPWGICVDKFGNIFVSDRRNNRVQVFNMDGTLKFKFGRKGVNNGEFDLPAGICVDIDNRIIVVDKDNHRVQIFSSTGVYLNKFGSYGKEYGQFQYPWDVAVNTRRQIVVTDSRNHRIQQFDSEGRFIRQIVFDNHGQTKGIASPRGVCYTPTGNIIVSDFDNHCLYLIDPEAGEVISTKGHEGSSFHEFNRPSGLCCDDEGRIIVADSKNQRVLVFNANLDFLWDIEVRPSVNPKMPTTLDEKDRTCDVAVMPDGRIVFLIELSPDSKEGSNPFKRFVHVC